jgi:hypothetical protein
MRTGRPREGDSDAQDGIGTTRICPVQSTTRTDARCLPPRDTLRASAHTLPENEVIAKHRSIVAGIVDDQTDEAILDVILQLEVKPDFAELTRFLSGFVLHYRLICATPLCIALDVQLADLDRFEGGYPGLDTRSAAANVALRSTSAAD